MKLYLRNGTTKLLEAFLKHDKYLRQMISQDNSVSHEQLKRSWKGQIMVHTGEDKSKDHKNKK